LKHYAAYVCSHLNNNEISATLSGGACVSIYTKNKYQSYDLDFILRFGTKRCDVKKCLNEIGFVEKGRYFVNDETPFFVEFPPGPLAICNEPIRDTSILEFSTGTLTLLTASDCLKDRLAGYFFWNDNQCLEQATLIAHDQNINFEVIELWAQKEGKLAEFKAIKHLLFT